MSNPINDGGPAFPLPPYTNPIGDFEWGNDGMSLRDWFAGMAMQALIVDPERTDQSRAECANLSYAMADAMLKQREVAT